MSDLEDFGTALKSRGTEIVQSILSGENGALSKLGKGISSEERDLLRGVASAVFENVKDPYTQGRIVGWVLGRSW